LEKTDAPCYLGFVFPGFSRFILALAIGAGLVPPALAGLTAVNDTTQTVQNVAVTISPLANDTDDVTNQIAILNVTAPTHGTVTVNSNSVPLSVELSNVLQFAAVQLSNTVKQLPSTNVFPRATMSNSPNVWVTAPASDDEYGWINGYFPGAMWYVYAMTGDTNYQTWARKWTGSLYPIRTDTNTDDVGFLLNCSFGNGYRFTGDAGYAAVLVQGAQSLSNRFNGVVGCLADDRLVSPPNFEVIMDTMLNLELLYVGANLSTNTNLSAMALSHENKAMLNQVRTNGSSWQEVIYNVTNGSVILQGQREGYNNTSTWARGQAWGVYGFSMACRESTNMNFMATAQKLADYYLTNTPTDYVPYWDFDAPGIPNASRDSSAAAITLSGLVEMSLLNTNLSDCATDWLGARHILSSLDSTNYLAKGTTSAGILLHGTGEPPKPTSPEVNVSLIYGDYYFVETLYRLAQIYNRTTVTYTPKPGFQGADTFTYQACDSAGNCSTATVTVNVQPFAVQLSMPPATPYPAITFPSPVGPSYFVQYRNDLVTSAWNSLATNLPGTGTNTTVMDTNPVVQRFYRAGMR
jgi:unsaturated chondroitin disaccharide hydrolase